MRDLQVGDAVTCHWLSPCLKVQGPGDQCVSLEAESDSGVGEMPSAQLELVQNRISMLMSNRFTVQKHFPCRTDFSSQTAKVTSPTGHKKNTRS